MKKQIPFYFLLCLVISCVSIPGKSRDSLEDQLKAENRMIKKNSELALRENEVLKTENTQYKAQVKKLNEAVERLTNDLGSLQQKYDEDLAGANEVYENLCYHFTALEIESDEKIQTLTEDYAALVDRFSDEVSKLNQEIGNQQESFEIERNALTIECDSRVGELETRLSSSKKESGEKDKKIKSLEKDHQEAGARITDLGKTINDQNEKLRQNDIKYQEMMLADQKMHKEIEEKQAVIDQLTAKLKAFQTPVEQTPSQ